MTDCFKAPSIAKGFTQVFGIDYDKTFKPVLKLKTISLMIPLATTSKWKTRQLNVKNVFLHNNIKETAYMEQPLGYVNPKFLYYICLLKKSLYDLK